jgi:hypothetical protein
MLFSFRRQLPAFHYYFAASGQLDDFFHAGLPLSPGQRCRCATIISFRHVR